VLLAVLWQFEGFEDTVDQPAQEDLLNIPGSITLEQFFNQGRFLVVLLVGQQHIKHIIDGIQEDTAHLLALVLWPLVKSNKVINVDINVPHGVLQWLGVGLIQWL
jgi:hypothetical protein